MLKSLIAVAGVALLLGACDSSQTQAVTAPPPPAPAAAPSYMVFFDWDRSDLSPQALSTIGQAAQSWKTGGNPKITAIGHTDTSGPADYNMALSLRRANAVKNALIQDGVPSAAIATVGKGETQPLVPTGDGVREPQNRRVEIVGFAGQRTSMVGVGVFKDPASYCKALSDKYREYRVQTPASTTPPAALAKCEEGNYAEGIPTLEDTLINLRIPLPSPGYRWPGRSYAPA
ncbi:MAG TPA: OmpA family protein [Reyranella sp.]|nr:OmpA family protein [Reyranella sp.]